MARYDSVPILIESQGGKMNKIQAVTENNPNRSYHSYWIEGTHNICRAPEEDIAKEVATVIRETKDIYAITLHTSLGIHVTTMVEKKDGD